MTMQFAVTLAGSGPRTERAGEASVTSQLLVEHFEDLVRATGSARLLKELVLHLAMQGRLSDGRAESVEPLLVEVHRARRRLAESGVRVRELLPVDHGDAPWTLPSGWAWVRLGELGGFLGGGTPSKSNSSFWGGPLPWVSPKDMKQPYIDDAEDHISIAAVDESAAKLIPNGSILCVVRGMILAHSFPVALTRREVAINQDMKALVLAVPAVGEFVLRACQEARARVLASVERSSHGTCRLDGEVVENLLIPFPPLAEQKLIVAKVDELMVLCDDLEARQTKKRETSTRLTKSALQALTTAEGPEEFDLAWRRVVDNFDVLVDRSERVAELRRAVLGLALQGRLSAREGGDGAASDALASAVADRTWRIEERPMKPKHDPKIEALAGVGVVPHSWVECRLNDCAQLINGRAYAQPELLSGGTPVIRIQNLNGGCHWYYSDLTLPGRQYCDSGDLLFAWSATFGPYIWSGGRAIYHYHIWKLNLSPVLDKRYLYFSLMHITDVVREQSHGLAMLHMTKGQMERWPILLPPLAEQRRIVGTVDQLMSVCDDLEARLTHAEDRASKLVEAVVQDLVA